MTGVERAWGRVRRPRWRYWLRRALGIAPRSLGESAAPVAFGYLSASVFAGSDVQADAFLLGLLPLAAVGLFALRAARSYLTDSAAADQAARPGSATAPRAGRSPAR